MKVHLGLGMVIEQAQIQKLEISHGTRSILEGAVIAYFQGELRKIQIPNELTALLGGQRDFLTEFAPRLPGLPPEIHEKLKEYGIDEKNLQRAITLIKTKYREVEFSLVSKEELESLDPDEKYGIQIGGLLLINKDIDPDFIPFIVWNLCINYAIDEGDQIHKKNEGYVKHWTANYIDIRMASMMLTPDRFETYLKLRIEAERTNYFQFDSECIEFVRSKVADTKRRRSLPPKEYGRYGRKSWDFATQILSLAQAGTLDMYKASELLGDLGVSKADPILLLIAQDARFDSGKMAKLIESMLRMNLSNKTKSGFDISIQDELIDQAILLSDDFLPDRQALLNRNRQNGRFEIKKFSSRTWEPLLNRLHYFSRRAMISAANKLNIEDISTNMGLLANFVANKKDGIVTLTLPNNTQVDFSLKNHGDVLKLKEKINKIIQEFEEGIKMLLTKEIDFEDKIKKLKRNTTEGINQVFLKGLEQKQFENSNLLNLLRHGLNNWRQQFQSVLELETIYRDTSDIEKIALDLYLNPFEDTAPRLRLTDGDSKLLPN